MALATANELSIIEGSLRLPRVGAWVFDLAVPDDDPAALTGAVDVDIGGVLGLAGTAIRVGSGAGLVTARVVGGAGGLAKVVEPKFYRAVPLSLVLSDLLGAAGERLAASCDAAALATLLPTWSRPAWPAGRVLGALVGEAAGASWRMLPDGSVWVGPETWPEVDFDCQLLQQDAYRGRVELGVEVPQLVPGTSFRGSRVDFVEHIIRAGAVRTRALFS